MRVGTLGSGARSCAGVRLAASSYCRACATDVQVADWWCQTVTVGYERIKGLRVGDARNVNLAAIRQEASRVSVWEEKIARPLRALHLDTLRNQILTFAVLATVIPTLTLYVVSFRQDRGALGDQLAPELTGASADAAWRIDQWLGERLFDLRTAATPFAVAENLARAQKNGSGEAVSQLRDYLTSVRGRCTDCDALVVSDARGRVITSSGGRMSGIMFTPDRLSALRTGESLVGDAYWDVGVGKPALPLAVPIRQSDGRYVGALNAKVNLRAVGEALQRLAPGDGGDLFIMAEQGRLILRARGSSAELMRTKLPSELTQPLFDKEGAPVPYRRGDGEEVLAVLRRVPALRWAVVAEIPSAAALRQAGSQESGPSPFMVLALLVGGALIACGLGLFIVRPVTRLTGAAAKVAAGDLSVDVPVFGSSDVVALAQVFKNLVTRLREREGQGELERLSVTDALTGLYNRRHLMGTLANEVQRSRRLRRTFSVLLADVDHFKQYNDSNGHLAGDAALVKIADILRKTTRGVDTVARYGGEEFVLMLIEAPVATAVSVGERIRERAAAGDFGGGKLTVSVGVAEYPTHGDTPEELIASADAAMYQAKSGGRDRVVAAGRRATVDKDVKKRRKGES